MNITLTGIYSVATRCKSIRFLLLGTCAHCRRRPFGRVHVTSRPYPGPRAPLLARVLMVITLRASNFVEITGESNWFFTSKTCAHRRQCYFGCVHVTSRPYTRPPAPKLAPALMSITLRAANFVEITCESNGIFSLETCAHCRGRPFGRVHVTSRPYTRPPAPKLAPALMSITLRASNFVEITGESNWFFTSKTCAHRREWVFGCVHVTSRPNPGPPAPFISAGTYGHHSEGR